MCGVPFGAVALDPDEQARAVIRLVIGLFDRPGTVNAVLCFLASAFWIDARRARGVISPSRPYPFMR